MKREELHIAEPCSADWDEMSGDDRKRFCDHCTKHVHNVSELNEEDARALVSTSDNLCVQYAFNRSGEILFTDSPDPHWRLYRQVEGLKRLVAAAAIALPMALATGCDSNTASAPDPVASSPLVIDETGGVKLQNQNQGASRSPSFHGTTNKPSDVEVLRGEPMAVETHEIVQGQAPVRDDATVTEPEEIIMAKGDVAYEPAHDEDEIECDSEKEAKGVGDPGEHHNIARGNMSDHR